MGTDSSLEPSPFGTEAAQLAFVKSLATGQLYAIISDVLQPTVQYISHHEVPKSVTLLDI